MSPKVEALRKIGVHPVVITPMSGTNRHQRRAEEAKAHQYRNLAQRHPVDWQQARRKARRMAAESRKQNR